MIRENKVYLNTIDDIINALNDGKTVFMEYTGDDDDINHNSKIKCFNGILIQETENNNVYLNPGDLSLTRYRFYIKGKKPLKIEVGKFYKTRSGVKVICVNKTSDSCYPCSFAVLGQTRIIDSTAKGEFVTGEENAADIVDYWED